jgi:hypothetical protein
MKLDLIRVIRMQEIKERKTLSQRWQLRCWLYQSWDIIYILFKISYFSPFRSCDSAKILPILTLIIFIVLTRIPHRVRNHNTKLIHIRSNHLRTVKFTSDILDHQLKMVLVASLDNNKLGGQCIFEAISQVRISGAACLLLKTAEESFVGDSGVQDGFFVTAAESAEPVNLDLNHNLAAGPLMLSILVSFGR